MDKPRKRKVKLVSGFPYCYLNDRSNITLLRLVVTAPLGWFYPQDWYYDEEFANVPLAVGEHTFWGPPRENMVLPTAVACANYYVSIARSTSDFLATNYAWTSDTDDKGNRVYVGGWNLGRKKGFQIHRHLANPVVSTPNYHWSKL